MKALIYLTSFTLIFVVCSFLFLLLFYDDEKLNFNSKINSLKTITDKEKYAKLVNKSFEVTIEPILDSVLYSSEQIIEIVAEISPICNENSYSDCYLESIFQYIKKNIDYDDKNNKQKGVFNLSEVLVEKKGGQKQLTALFSSIAIVNNLDAYIIYENNSIYSAVCGVNFTKLYNIEKVTDSRGASLEIADFVNDTFVNSNPTDEKILQRININSSLNTVYSITISSDKYVHMAIFENPQQGAIDLKRDDFSKAICQGHGKFFTSNCNLNNTENSLFLYTDDGSAALNIKIQKEKVLSYNNLYRIKISNEYCVPIDFAEQSDIDVPGRLSFIPNSEDIRLVVKVPNSKHERITND